MNSPANYNSFCSPDKFHLHENGFDKESCSNSTSNKRRKKDDNCYSGVKSESFDEINGSSNKRALLHAELTPTELAERMPSSRLSIGMAGRLRDIVAIFPQNELAAPENLLFREQTTNSDQRVFSAKGQVNFPGMKGKEIDFIGREEAAGEGFEYVLAIVDKRTGRPLEFRRTALINFQLSTEKEAAREKNKKNVNYSNDFSLSLDKKQEDRKRLTLDFGSVKKNKMLDARIRRSVTNETLEAMTSTAFSSANFKATGVGEENDEENIEKKFSILGQVQSSVLPKPNLSALVPGEVYSLGQFLPEMSEEFLHELQEEAVKFFRQNETAQKLLNLSVPSVVAKRLGNPLRYGNPTRRCFLSLKVIALVKLTQTVHKFAVREIRKLSSKEVEALNFIPPKMLGHIREAFLALPKGNKGKVFYEISSEQRSRILAELLCILLLFDDPEFTLPISPLVQDLCVPENVLKNLLVAMGCVVTVASEAQALSMNTIRVARLIGPPDGKSAFSMGRSRKQRRTN